MKASITPFTLTQHQKFILLSLFALSLLIIGNPAYADIFADGKTPIKEATSDTSTLYYALQWTAIAMTAWFGLQQKNWFGAIGGFAAFEIFLGAAMGMLPA